MWFVDGEGVLDVHGYLYWDGEQLFVQSHDPRQPIFSGGVPVPLDWTPVASPVVLQLGHVQISFSAVGPVLSDAPTQLGQSAGYSAPDFQGLHAHTAGGSPLGATPVLLGAPSKAATMPPPGGKNAATSSLQNPRQRLMLGAIVVMLGGAGWLLLGTTKPQPPSKVAPAPTAAPTAPVVVVAPPAPREAIPLAPVAPLAKGAVAPPSELRGAIDALLAGRETEAIRMFEALSVKYPGHPELQASVLLLRGLRPTAK